MPFSLFRGMCWLNDFLLSKQNYSKGAGHVNRLPGTRYEKTARTTGDQKNKSKVFTTP